MFWPTGQRPPVWGRIFDHFPGTVRYHRHHMWGDLTTLCVGGAEQLGLALFSVDHVFRDPHTRTIEVRPRFENSREDYNRREHRT